MKEKTEELVKYIQERCLWQFFSRSWDREDNIGGIMTQSESILLGKNPVLETQMDRCWYADATILVDDLKRLFPWITAASPDEIRTVIDRVKQRMREIAIEKSRNEELNINNY